MRRRSRKRYIDLCEEYLHQQQWEEVADGCRASMKSFDAAPPHMRKMIDDTGVNADHAMAWYRYFLRMNPPHVADKLAADHVRELVHQQHEECMAQAARELLESGRAVSRRLAGARR